MIGRGSRILPNKKEFTVIDLGNNLNRFGLWDAPVDWTSIFRTPELYSSTTILPSVRLIEIVSVKKFEPSKNKM